LESPVVRAGDLKAIARSVAGFHASHLKGGRAMVDSRLPTIRKKRPAKSWAEVVRTLNAYPQTRAVEWLKRMVRSLVNEHMGARALLDTTP
jgi:hypothetical protein